MNLNAVRLLTVRARQEGVPEVAAALGRLADAYDDVGKSAEKTESTTEQSAKRQLSVAAAWQKQTLALDECARNQDRVARAIKVADQALAQGLITQDQYIARLTLITDKFGSMEKAAMAAAAANRKLAAQAMVNKQTIVPDRAADIAAYGKAMDDLRVKFSPLYAAQRIYKDTLTEINQAYRVGAISERERADAVMNTKVAFVQQVNSLRGVRDGLDQAGHANDNFAKSAGLARHEMINLGRQMQDVATMLAMGASPMNVITSQAAQVVDIFASSQGTVGGFFKQMTGWLGGFLTAGRVAFGGVTAAIGLGVAALSSYLSGQMEVRRALIGIGVASGMTVGGINAVASQSASPLGFSVSEAREFASALASVGRIGRDEIGSLTRLGHDFAATLGVDSKDAAQALGKALADPVRGATELNQRLGFLDAGQQRIIQNLVQTNRLAEAQRIIIDGIRSSIASANDVTGFWSKTWTAISNAISNAWDGLGQILARATGVGETLDDQYAKAKKYLDDLQERRAKLGVGAGPAGDDAFSTAAYRQRRGVVAGGPTQQEIDTAVANEQRLAKAIAERAAATELARQRMESFQIASTARSLLPEIDQLQQLKNAQDLLVRTMIDVQVTGGPASEVLKRLGLTYEQLAAAVAKATAEVKDFATVNQRAQAQNAIALDAVTAFSPGARADIARRQALEANRGNPEAQARAQEAYAIALKQATVAISEQARERALAARQETVAAQVSITAIGQNVGEQYRLQAVQQARAQLEQEAARNRTAFDQAQFEALQRQIAKTADLKQIEAERKAQSDANFALQTVFMSETERQIAAVQRQLHGDAWKDFMNDGVAASMRLEAALKQIGSAVDSAFGSLASDLISGKNAMDALVSSASSLGRSLTEIGSKSLVGSLKSGLGGAGFGFDPVSLGAGAVGLGISLISNILDGNRKAEEEASRAKEAWAGMTDQMNQFIRAADGFDLSNFASAIYQAKQTLDQLWVAAMKANDTMGAMRVANAFAQTVWSQMDAFARSVGPAMSDAATAIETQQRAAKQLIQSMQDVGFYSEQAGNAIRDNLAKQIAYLQDQASKSLVADINSATGKGFVNDINSLLEKYNQLKQDASITGVDTSLIDRWFTVQAQKVVDDTGLIGDSFNELLRLFPNLTGKVNESADALQKAADVQAEYQNSLNQTARSIVDYLNNLNAGSDSTLSPTQRLYAAQSAYQSTLSLAQQNNQQALGRITTDADNWLKAARDVFASGAGYQSILQQIQSQLAGLPAVQTSTDPVVQALLNVQGVMQNVLTGVNNVNAGVGGVASGVNNVKLSVDSTTGMVTATRDAVNGTTGAIGGTTSAVNANTGSTYNIVDKTVDRLNVAIERFSSAVSLLSQTVGALNSSVALLDAIRGLQDTSKQQLQILASQNRASSFTTSVWNGFGVGVGGRFDPASTSTNNSMLEALNKIAFNTYATSLNTANLAAVGTSSANRVLIGTFATGGTLGAGGFGIFGEHHPDGPWLMKAGTNPVPITPALPTFASNDNSAMVAELRALRAEVANLQRVVAASGNQVTRAVVAASDENVAVTEDAGKRMAFEVARTSRDNKAA